MRLCKDTVIHRLGRVPYKLHTQLEKNPRRPRAHVLLIHGIGVSSSVWDKVISHLPDDIQVTTVDLLGFGLSPRPAWAQYDAKRQAQSVIRSYDRLRLRGPVIIVGHSLGALVAVEVARMRPRLIQSLVLCSPPFYTDRIEGNRKLPTSDDALKRIYRAIQAYPDQFVKISALAAKYKLINRGFQVTDENIHAYMSALEASIVNQTSLKDVQTLKQPIRLLYGTLDPVVVTRRLKRLEQSMSNVSIKGVVAAHEIKGPYVTVVSRSILAAIDEQLTVK